MKNHAKENMSLITKTKISCQVNHHMLESLETIFTSCGLLFLNIDRTHFPADINGHYVCYVCLHVHTASSSFTFANFCMDLSITVDDMEQCYVVDHLVAIVPGI